MTGSRLRVDCSRTEASPEIIKPLVGNGLRGMVEEKLFCTLELIFPSMPGFIDHSTGIVEHAQIMRLHTIYYYLVSFLTGYRSGKMTDDVHLGELRQHIIQFKRCLEATLHGIYETMLSKLEFVLLEPVLDKLERFRQIEVLDSSLF